MLLFDKREAPYELHSLTSIDYEFYALGGPCTVRLEGFVRADGRTGADTDGTTDGTTDAKADVNTDAKAKVICAGAEKLLGEFEQRYSRYVSSSVISQVNGRAGSGQWTELDEQGSALLNFAFSMHEHSGGCFDITSGVLRRVWDFRSQTLPSSSQVSAILPLVGMHNIEWKPPFVRLNKAGMELDFGGFGKEFAADMLAAWLQQQGVAHGLVELAGDIAVVGPRQDGSAWSVGISDPAKPESAVATVELGDGALASSGTYQRNITIDGDVYSHLLDPQTGWPVRTYQAVSVIHHSCLVAGALASISLLKGNGAGGEWLQRQGVDYLLVSEGGGLQGTLC